MQGLNKIDNQSIFFLNTQYVDVFADRKQSQLKIQTKGLKIRLIMHSMFVINLTHNKYLAFYQSIQALIM